MESIIFSLLLSFSRRFGKNWTKWWHGDIFHTCHFLHIYLCSKLFNRIGLHIYPSRHHFHYTVELLRLKPFKLQTNRIYLKSMDFTQQLFMSRSRHSRNREGTDFDVSPFFILRQFFLYQLITVAAFGLWWYCRVVNLRRSTTNCSILNDKDAFRTNSATSYDLIDKIVKFIFWLLTDISDGFVGML